MQRVSSNFLEFGDTPFNFQRIHTTENDARIYMALKPDNRKTFERI